MDDLGGKPHHLRKPPHGEKKHPAIGETALGFNDIYSAKETAQGVVASAPDSETWEAGTTNQPTKQPTHQPNKQTNKQISTTPQKNSTMMIHY